jgi:hypothetical protein
MRRRHEFPVPAQVIDKLFDLCLGNGEMLTSGPG